MKRIKKGQAIETIHSFVHAVTKQLVKSEERRKVETEPKKSSISDQEVFPIENK